MQKNYFSLGLMLSIALIVSACSGSATTTTAAGTTATAATATTTSATSTLALSSSSVSVIAGDTYNLSASGGVSPYYYYVVSGSGTVNETTGVFTASTTTGSTEIEVTDSAGDVAYGYITTTSSTTTTTGGSVSISPTAVTLTEDASYTFIATGGTGSYTYEVLDGVGSIVSTTGVFTAPDAAGISTVEVVDTDGNTATATVTTTAASTAATTVPFYREFDSSSFKHMSTTTSGEGAPAYTVDEQLGYIYSSQYVSTAVALYRCRWVKGGHFTTTSSTCEGAAGAEMDGQMGWIDSVQQSGEVPLYRLFSSKKVDHMDSLDSGEGFQLGYELDFVIGYVVPVTN